jgi:hypothetical protein
MSNNYYTHYHFGYNMIDRANYETNSICEMRNFINLITQLYSIGWQRNDLLSLLSQLYTVFEGKNDYCRCNEIDNAIEHVDNVLFTSNQEDETITQEEENDYLPVTPERVNNYSFSDPPPIQRVQINLNDLYSRSNGSNVNNNLFDAEFYENVDDDGWRTVSNQLYQYY